MKKQPIVILLAAGLLNLLSCSRSDNAYITAPALDVSVYPQVAAGGLISLGKKGTVLESGTTATFFVPYRVVADEIRNAELLFTDSKTGTLLYRVPMQTDADVSLVNINVPEELQGHRFSFVTLPVNASLKGHEITLRAALNGRHLQSGSELPLAFIVP